MRHETFDELVARVNRNAYIPPLHEGNAMAKGIKLKAGKEFTFEVRKKHKGESPIIAREAVGQK